MKPSDLNVIGVSLKQKKISFEHILVTEILDLVSLNSDKCMKSCEFSQVIV